MNQQATMGGTAQPAASQARKIRNARLLACGIASTPLFYLLALLQLIAQPGYDIQQLPLSYLSLARWGWLQDLNFIAAGLLALAGAVGVRQYLRGQRGGSWGALLIGAYGIGMVLAGLCPPDPAFGLPDGTPPGPAAAMSGRALVHTIGFFLSFFSLMAATLVFARRYAGLRRRGWMAYCLLTAGLAPVLFGAGMASPWPGIVMALTGLLLFGWISVITAQLRREALQR